MKFNVSEHMVMYAFRYALGRKTGAVIDVVEFLKDNWTLFNDFTQKQIQDEIKKAIEFGQAGSDFYIEMWKILLETTP